MDQPSPPDPPPRPTDDQPSTGPEKLVNEEINWTDTAPLGENDTRPLESGPESRSPPLTRPQMDSSAAKRTLIFHRFDPDRPETLLPLKDDGAAIVESSVPGSLETDCEQPLGEDPSNPQQIQPLQIDGAVRSDMFALRSDVLPSREQSDTDQALTGQTASDPASDPSDSDLNVVNFAELDTSAQDCESGQLHLAKQELGDAANELGDAADETDCEEPPHELAVQAGRSIAVTQRRPQERRPEPIRHGLVMLLTVVGMLATARYILPGIVEEIRYAQHRGQLRAEFEVASEGLKNVSLDTLSQAYQMVNAAAGPSVVHIDIRRISDQRVSRSEIPGAPSIPISDQGSGVVVDADGYILTNRHVIASSEEITVTLSDGRIVGAFVVGTDELTDLAVLKVDADDLIPIPWGDSERIRVGSPVWAIGSPFGLDRTVTFGILSGKHRIVRAKDRYQDFMQSDVAVNPGNSGGPLVDSRGTLIGINTAIVGDTYQGVSFAIPSDVAKKIYQTLRETGSIERGWLGVTLKEVPDELLPGENHRLRGAMIVSLADATSGAARAGLQSGDIVVRVDLETIRDVDHLMQVIGNAMAGSRLKLSILREGEQLQLPVSLGMRPPILDR